MADAFEEAITAYFSPAPALTPVLWRGPCCSIILVFFVSFVLYDVVLCCIPNVACVSYLSIID
jgi:hypothetical protein